MLGWSAWCLSDDNKMELNVRATRGLGGGQSERCWRLRGASLLMGRKMVVGASRG